MWRNHFLVLRLLVSLLANSIYISAWILSDKIENKTAQLTGVEEYPDFISPLMSVQDMTLN